MFKLYLIIMCLDYLMSWVSILAKGKTKKGSFQSSVGIKGLMVKASNILLYCALYFVSQKINMGFDVKTLFLIPSILLELASIYEHYSFITGNKVNGIDNILKNNKEIEKVEKEDDKDEKNR